MGKTIKAKITWMVILIVIIGLLASNGISFFLASQTIVEGQRESLQVSAEEFAQEIDTWFESERTMTEGVVYNVNLLNTAKPSVKNLTKIVIAHAANRDELLNLYIGTEDKSFAQSNLDAETPEGYDPTERGWYQAAANAGTTIVTDPYMDVLVGGMCITIASPIYYDGNLIGVVGADVTLDTINSIMNSIPEDDGQYGFLVDSSGNYIIHENEEFLPGEDSVVAVADISDSVSEIISEPGSKLVETNDYDGQKNFFATASSEKSGWVLGLAMPSDSIYATSITNNIYTCHFGRNLRCTSSYQKIIGSHGVHEKLREKQYNRRRKPGEYRKRSSGNKLSDSGIKRQIYRYHSSHP